MRLPIICFVIAAACSAQNTPGMNCENRTLVRLQRATSYSAAKAKEHYDAHVKFIGQALKKGDMIMAGPAGDGTGLAVFKSTDPEHVKKVMAQDPFIVNGVLTFQAVGWRQCVAASE